MALVEVGMSSTSILRLYVIMLSLSVGTKGRDSLLDEYVMTSYL